MLVEAGRTGGAGPVVLGLHGTPGAPHPAGYSLRCPTGGALAQPVISSRRPAEQGGGGGCRRGGAERGGWRQAVSFVYLTAKYQGNHRLAALPPTPTAKTNSWAKRMPELS